MKRSLLILITILTFSNAQSQELNIVQQNYAAALKVAAQDSKLVLIDFYTTWCVPCKKVDKLIFQNDSIGKILNQNFVVLKYDAEKDTVFNLSKKYHIFSYPTAVILNKDGFVLNKIFGFKGDDFNSLSESLNQFTSEAIALNKENKVISGYTNSVDISKYPDFYKKYVNRQQLKVDSSDFLSYWKNSSNVLSEEYFSTLLYFGDEVPGFVADMAEKNKGKYEQLYGALETDILFYKLSSSKVNYAISTKSTDSYNKAIAFTKRNLGDNWTKTMIPGYEIDFLKAQKKWNEVFKIKEKEKQEGKLSDGYINNFCYQAYKDCDDVKVLSKFANWMKELTDKDPSYEYLDTYAFLLFKAARKSEAKEITKLAIEAAKKENAKTKGLEELLKKL